MMQTKAKEEPDDTMGSGAMGIATTEVDGWQVSGGIHQPNCGFHLGHLGFSMFLHPFYIHVLTCFYLHSHEALIETLVGQWIRCGLWRLLAAISR